MQLLATGDITSLSYWLNWTFLLCAIWVFTPMFISSYLIWKYEWLNHLEPETGGTRQERAFLHYDEAWMPCVKKIQPIWLMFFRITSFCLLLGVLTVDVVVHGWSLFYFYTQWTFTLVTIYFGFGSILSIYGSYQHHRICRGSDVHHVRIDAEQGFYVPLTCDKAAKGGTAVKYMDRLGKNYVHKVASLWGSIFQVVFQITAGAVMLTDCVYWIVIFPFLTIKDYEPGFLTVAAHSLNAILLIGDTALNSLRFPWFRISYFFLWTGFYVIFHWILHACVSIWWPYPFLDLTVKYAPLWYLLVALMHIPCYGIFQLIVGVKYYVLSRWFSQSYQCLR